MFPTKSYNFIVINYEKRIIIVYFDEIASFDDWNFINSVITWAYDCYIARKLSHLFIGLAVGDHLEIENQPGRRLKNWLKLVLKKINWIYLHVMFIYWPTFFGRIISPRDCHKIKTNMTITCFSILGESKMI